MDFKTCNVHLGASNPSYTGSLNGIPFQISLKERPSYLQGQPDVIRYFAHFPFSDREIRIAATKTTP